MRKKTGFYNDDVKLSSLKFSPLEYQKKTKFCNDWNSVTESIWCFIFNAIALVKKSADIVKACGKLHNLYIKRLFLCHFVSPKNVKLSAHPKKISIFLKFRNSQHFFNNSDLAKQKSMKFVSVTDPDGLYLCQKFHRVCFYCWGDTYVTTWKNEIP